MTDYRNLSLQELKGLNRENDGDWCYFMGMAYMEVAEPESAIKWLERAVSLLDGARKGKAAEELAVVYMADGHAKTNKAKALELFKKHPERPQCNLFAGLILYNDFNDRAEGRRLVEKGISGCKEHNTQLDPYILSKVSKMYRGENEYGKAQTYLEQAVSICEAMGDLGFKNFILQEALE